VSLSTHVLDATRGTPARGLHIRWESRGAPAPDPDLDPEWIITAIAVTDDDGRVTAVGWRPPDPVGVGAHLLGQPPTPAGDHRLVFATGAWFAVQQVRGFYPEVVVTFTVTSPTRHHHVPLLLSPFSYSTYRGS
jgi:5-hydroxyisourate hydrolase